VRALVTGGGGFLGAALARKLRERGDEVRVFGRGSYPELEAIGIDCAKATSPTRGREGRLRRPRRRFHVAAKVGLWGPYEEFHEANVEGTKNVLRACQEHGIRKLVFTGSPSVVFHGGDVDGLDESAPYPSKFDSLLKTGPVERMVLAADHDRLDRVLRPHFIWGPGTRKPCVIACQKAGRLFASATTTSSWTRST
jgi:nucleoside-diphosphate-sugar epimerase